MATDASPSPGMKLARLTTLGVAAVSAVMGTLYSLAAIRYGFAQPLAGAVAAGALAAVIGSTISALTHNRTDDSDIIADYVGKQLTLAGAIFAGLGALATLSGEEASYWWWALGVVVGVTFVICLVLVVVRLRRTHSR